MTIDALKAMLADGTFHHATYRCQNTLWEGLWIYKRDSKGFRGYSPVGAFNKSDGIALEMAFSLTAQTGVSVGSYGKG